jgi:hypothetical protein
VRIRRWEAIAAASFVIVGGIAVGAAPAASADQVWHQSIGRASQDSPCPTSTALDLVEGWSEWGSSWEKWPKAGTGGWTCTRSITWAKDSGRSYTCAAWTAANLLLKFDGVNALPIGTPLYSDADCTTLSGSSTDYYWAVYASTVEGAQTICDRVTGDRTHVAFNRLGMDIVLGTNVWACVPSGL